MYSMNNICTILSRLIICKASLSYSEQEIDNERPSSTLWHNELDRKLIGISCYQECGYILCIFNINMIIFFTEGILCVGVSSIRTAFIIENLK